MIKIFLNGQPVVPQDIQGETGITIEITIEDEQTGKTKKRATGELTFYGAAYQVIKTELIDPPDGKLREVPLVIYEDCGDPAILLFTGVVRGAEVDWCEGCDHATATAVEKTVATQAQDCIESTLIADNRNGFRSQQHPRMVYCDEIRPEWLHHIVMILSVILVLILYVLTPIVVIVTAIIQVINWIIDAVNVLPGVDIDHIDFDGDQSTNFLDEYVAWRDRLIDGVIGCGRKHPSPLLRSYIGNVCSICGINFQSSIINDPTSDYYNTVLFSAPVSKGTRDDSVTYIDDNEPIETLDTLLGKLCTVFNAGRRIVGNTLYFERKDMLPGSGVWVNPAELKAAGRLVEGVCFSWSSDDIPAFIQIGFTEDALDITGNEARDIYKDIVEWNQPYNPVQKGSVETMMQFSMLRCRRDGIGSDVLDDYDGVWWLSDAITSYNTALLLECGLSALPKLIVWDGDMLFGTARRFNVPGYFKTYEENYNFPYHMGEFNCAPNTGYPTTQPYMSLYGRFHAIRNPKVLSTAGRDFDFKFEYTAAELASMDIYADVPLSFGTGHMTSIIINTTDRTIAVSGKV